MTDRYRLHYAPDNASLIIRLVLEELRQPYEGVLVDRQRQQQRSPAYRALNPAGLIPVLETCDGPIFETGAILLWLSDQHGALAPAPQSPGRAGYLKWLFFTSNTLHAQLRLQFYPEKYASTAPVALRTGVQKALADTLRHLDQAARAGLPYLASNPPSALDYYLACCLRWCALYPPGETNWFRLADFPHLQMLAQRLEHRAATQAAIVAEGLGPTPFSNPTYATPPEGSAT